MLRFLAVRKSDDRPFTIEQMVTWRLWSRPLRGRSGMGIARDTGSTSDPEDFDQELLPNAAESITPPNSPKWGDDPYPAGSTRDPAAFEREDMFTQAQLMEVINGIDSEVNGFMGASVVDAETGMPLAAKSSRADFDLEAASAYNTEMVKAKQKTIRVLNIQSELEDMLLTLGDQLHLIKMLDQTTFIYVAANRQETNLALLRATVNRYAQRLNG